MDLARLRFGDWVFGFGGIAVLVVMFMDWYEPALSGESSDGWTAYAPVDSADIGHNAWQSFAVNDVILAIGALCAVTAFVLTVFQPTAAVPLAFSSLALLPCALSLILVAVRIIWPPDISTGEAIDTARLTGAWLGLVATTLLTGGCLASLRDERLPQPDHPAEPRLVQP